MKDLSDILRSLDLCSNISEDGASCIGCSYFDLTHSGCEDKLLKDVATILEPFTWLGKHIWIVAYDPENELCMIEENVINEVGVHYFWFSEFSPPTADLGNVMLISDIGKTVFFEKEAAEKVLKLLIERGKSNEF